MSAARMKPAYYYRLAARGMYRLYRAIRRKSRYLVRRTVVMLRRHPDGGGGIACTAQAIGKIIANLNSSQPAISTQAVREIFTPPAHYGREQGFDPTKSEYYSKGFKVLYSGAIPWVSHGGMTNHCGGVIGHNVGYQFVAVSNWNNAQQPYVDSILGHALGEAVGKL